MFEQEIKATNGKTNAPMFSLCCQQGRVKLPEERQPPEILKKLLNDSQNYQKNIRLLNSLFAFTLMGAKLDHKVMYQGGGPFTYRIQGQNCHRIGSLLPKNGEMPRYLQLYIFDTANEKNNRLAAVNLTSRDSDVDQTIIDDLMIMVDTHNNLAKVFRKARDIYEEENTQEFSIRLIGQKKRGRQYDTPSADEIAGLIVGDFDNSTVERDVIVNSKSEGLQQISDLNPLFMSLQYPLLFPYGDIGYHEGIPTRDKDGKKHRRSFVTKREFYAYQIQTRFKEGMTIIRSKRLLHQYIVDAYTSLEQERLRWIRNNQKKLRADLYNNVRDAVTRGDTDAKAIGQRIILPATYTGSPRYMVEKYHDAMAICRWFGNPDLFITMTCNPNWQEITNHLQTYGEDVANDRPDIECRVFKMKFDELLDDFRKGKFFSKPIAGIPLNK